MQVPDGYVACESYKDTHDWEHVANMERAMQVCYDLFSTFFKNNTYLLTYNT